MPTQLTALLRRFCPILGLFLSVALPTQAETLFVTKQTSFRQTASATVEVVAPTLEMSASLSGTYRAANAQVYVRPANSPTTFTFLPASASEPGEAFFVYKATYATLSQANQAMPVGPYTFSAFAGLAGTTSASSLTSNFSLTADFPASSPRIGNFDALQSWDGQDFSLSWSPFDGTVPTSLIWVEIERADGTELYSTSDKANAAGSEAAKPIRVSSVPGETLFATLYHSRPVSNTTTSSVSAVITQLTSLRVPIKRLPSVAPTISAHPQSRTVTIGETTTFSVTATSDFLTYTWKKDGTAISGATNATLTLTNISTADAGSYTVTATNSGGSLTSNAATLSVVAATVAPTISAAPANLTILAGAKSILTVTPAGTAPFTYQWLRNGTPITGATSATLTLDPTLVSDAAAYSVTVTNSAGSVTSPAATLTVTPISRISNLSVLTSLSTPTDTFTLGYVVGGNATSGNKLLVLRAAGPSLGALGVGGTLDDPKLELFAGSAKTGENDNWGGSAALTTALAAVGAFPYSSPTSNDAATTAGITTRDNSVKISAAASGTGLVLAEIYDATPTDTFTTATPRLLNVSVLKSLGTGLTVGFTIAGTTPKTVLIRAIGPTLGEPPFGVPGTVADPQLSLFSAASPTPLASNDNWSVPVGPAPAATALTAAFTATGAFGLPSSSKDAALLTTLPPGGYSVQVTGVANTTGTALVEVYEVP